MASRSVGQSSLHHHRIWAICGNRRTILSASGRKEARLVDIRRGHQDSEQRCGGVRAMNSFDLIPDLKIGHIVEVSGTTIRVELSGDVTELTRTHDGRVYPIGQMGSIVKVHFGRRLVFGFVTLLRMRSEELLEAAKPIPPDPDQRVMEVELFAEG